MFIFPKRKKKDKNTNKNKEKKIILGKGQTRFDLAPMYLHLRMENQGYVVIC